MRLTTIADIRLSVCPFCGAGVVYNPRAGRMPLACDRLACKHKARKQGRKSRAPMQEVKE